MAESVDLHPDLPNGPEFAENVVHLLRRDFVRQVAHVEDAVDFRRQPHVRSLPRHRHDEADGRWFQS